MTDRSPRNTSTTDALDKFLVAASPDGIESQERAGQAEVLQSTTLPAEILWSTAEDFEALGFTFGELVDGDPLFRQASLPEGWKREGSDHAMWSYIVDGRGIRRVAVFYKAAFYDRHAHMGLQNVGRTLASEFIYGDEEVPNLPEGLTVQERADLVEEAQTYLARAAEHPDIYGDRVPRATALVEVIDA